MAYSELIKNFNRIRDYMRQFYIYGFKSRDGYNLKSGRSYDDERRRIESWLGDYMRFRQTPDGKNVFLSIDSRDSRHNPLYKAWKAKSFTDGDITLHFLLLDILKSAEKGITLSEIVDEIYARLPETAKLFDESTIRKKLKEYVGEGIVNTEKSGKALLYSPGEITDSDEYNDLLDFFSEVAPCGVVGSFILDKTTPHDSFFSFKHHYITSALDSEVLCEILSAMGQKRYITFETVNGNRKETAEENVIPLKIMQSVQNGRQYLMAYVPWRRRITSFRIDNIASVKIGEECELFDSYSDMLNRMRPYMWGVSTRSRSGKFTEHVDFTVKYADDEQYIPRRLEREKRVGTLERLDGNTVRFSAEVYDAAELIPWIRTFICRITEIRFSDENLQRQFENDIKAMYDIYGIAEGGEQNDVQ